MLTQIPNGLDEVIKTFGPTTEVPKHLVTFDLPYPLLYQGSAVHKATCHKLVVDNFVQAFKAIQDAQLEALVLRYGGLYANRVIRGGTTPSMHAFGIAIDLEPEKYPLGSDARFPDAVIAVFHRFGFFYGGDFEGRKDPMHFELCRGC